MKNVIHCSRVSKIYPLFASRTDRIKELLHPFRRKYHTDFFALRDVDLQIPPGQTTAIIGRNGSGKSTLLKILSGVTWPTSGTARVAGRVASLLELGAGFHPELSGLDNVYLHGLLRGRTRSQTRQVIESIQDFAGIGPYIHQPVKSYSSGMFVRLAFAAEIHTMPEVFFVDEALSVGDAHFQIKCIRRMRELASAGTTVLFVSHDASLVRGLCERAVLLDRGAVAADGAPAEVYDVYSGMIGLPDEQSAAQSDFARRSGTGEVRFKSLTLLDASARPRSTFTSGETAALALELSASTRIENPTIGFSIRDKFGQDVFGTNTALLGTSPPAIEPGQALRFEFRFPLNLGAGAYEISASIHHSETHIGSCYDWINGALQLTIQPDAAYRFSGTARLPVTFSPAAPDGP